MPRAQRREALGQPAGDTDPFYDGLADNSEPVRGTLIRSKIGSTLPAYLALQRKQPCKPILLTCLVGRSKTRLQCESA